MSDPYMPDWNTAPDWANYHTIDPDGQGVWWSNAGIVLGPDGWYHDSDTIMRLVMDTTMYAINPFDWQNSLRARPDGQWRSLVR